VLCCAILQDPAVERDHAEKLQSSLIMVRTALQQQQQQQQEK
jgi:hypothetical protein